jgi:hypothetical protein
VDSLRDNGCGAERDAWCVFGERLVRQLVHAW